MLSERDRAFYRENGYLVVKNVLSAGEVATLRRTVDGIVDQARGVAESNEVYDLEASHTAQQPRVRRIKMPTNVDPYFWTIARHPNIIDAVTSLIGPNVRLHTNKLNLKSAGHGAPVEWHQDWAFYPHTNDDVLAVGVMIDDMGDDNGPLMVIPGSHKGPVFDHHRDGRFCGAIAPDADGFDMSKAAKLSAPAGSISIHHVRALHGSELNRSGRDRRLLLFEMTAADAWPLAGAMSPFSTLEEYDSRLLAGDGTATPRLTAVPVKIPLPGPAHAGSIYENQRVAARFFDTYTEEPEAVA